MLLQTNSYVVPKDKRLEHAKLMRRFRQTLVRLGCVPARVVRNRLEDYEAAAQERAALADIARKTAASVQQRLQRTESVGP